MVRRVGLAALAAVLMAGVVACGDSGDSGGDGTTGATTAHGARGAELAFLVPVQNGYIQAQVDGAKAVAARRGASIKTVFAADGDPAKQINQLRDAVASGQYDGLIVNPIAPQLKPSIEAAAKAGLPLAVIGSWLGSDPLEVTPVPGVAVTAGQPGMARVEGFVEMLTSACGEDPCDVGWIMGLPIPADTATLDAVKAQLASHANIRIVATGVGRFQTGPARTVAADMLRAHPEIDVIVANSDDMTRGAELAAQAAGRDDVELIGAGASKDGCAAVEAGRWFGTANDVPTEYGVAAADGLLNTLDDPARVDQVVDPLEQSGFGPASTSGGGKCPAQWSN